MLPPQRTAEPSALAYPEAVRCLLDEFAWNSWFLDSYWPENEPRIRLLVRLALDHMPANSRVLEVGCANGYVAYLFRLLGFEVAANDAYDDEKRAELFRKGGVSYQETNLNVVDPLSDLPSESFDLVLLGEVFEHILNQPAGLLKSIYRLLRPGGMLILTTPNPSTLMNAVRIVRDVYILWGTAEFLRETKMDGGEIIDRGDIHYREYPAWVVRDLMGELGYMIDGVNYVRAGISSAQPVGKRWMKRLMMVSGLARLRLFCPGYVIWARKPG